MATAVPVTGATGLADRAARRAVNFRRAKVVKGPQTPYMRAFLATSIGVACSAALVLPLPLTSGAAAAPSRPAAVPRGDAVPRSDVPGSTQSLALAATGADRSGGTEEEGLTERHVRPFSLLGVVWDDAGAELRGTVQVRTRGTGTGTWSGWQDLGTHNEEHSADLGTQEREAATVRGATAPLWVGDSDGAQVRVRGEALPRGLRLELVNPGPDEADEPDDSRATTAPDTPGKPDTPGEDEASAANEGLAELGATEIPSLTKAQTEERAQAHARTEEGAGLMGPGSSAKPYIGARPRIVTRKGWGADERIRGKSFGYTKSVKVAFVHHTDTGNNYSCKRAASVLRGIYRYHVKSNGWRDIGYNFAIDKCGTIYEGRAGGVAKPVMGAHTLGFNTNSTGIAVLGTYNRTNPPAAVTTAVAKLSAWKLGLHKVDPKSRVTMTSLGSNKYGKGRKVKLRTISGHKDGYITNCPGARLYKKLGAIRTSAARYQGR